MTKHTDKRGRRKGSRSKGYFYRTGRGWFTKNGAGAFVPLLSEAGDRLREDSRVAARDHIVQRSFDTVLGVRPSAKRVCALSPKHSEG